MLMMREMSFNAKLVLCKKHCSVLQAERFCNEPLTLLLPNMFFRLEKGLYITLTFFVLRFCYGIQPFLKMKNCKRQTWHQNQAEYPKTGVLTEHSYCYPSQMPLLQMRCESAADPPVQRLSYTLATSFKMQGLRGAKMDLILYVLCKYRLGWCERPVLLT